MYRIKNAFDLATRRWAAELHDLLGYRLFQNRDGEARVEPKRLKTTAQQELRPPKWRF